MLREPPDSWLELLAKQHHNNAIDAKQLEDALKSDKLIKIPDVYKVSMRFQSLLPASFNNYVYNYVCNKNVIHKVDGGAYKMSGAAEALPGGMAKYMKRVAQVWEKNDEAAGGSKEADAQVAAVQKSIEDAREAKKKEYKDSKAKKK